MDRYGTIFEGRRGGVHLPVLGAHTGGYNTDSFGVCVMGNFEEAEPPEAALASLTELIAWKLALSHQDPRGMTWLGGSTIDRMLHGVLRRLVGRTYPERRRRSYPRAVKRRTNPYPTKKPGTGGTRPARDYPPVIAHRPPQTQRHWAIATHGTRRTRETALAA